LYVPNTVRHTNFTPVIVPGTGTVLLGCVIGFSLPVVKPLGTRNNNILFLFFYFCGYFSVEMRYSIYAIPVTVLVVLVQVQVLGSRVTCTPMCTTYTSYSTQQSFLKKNLTQKTKRWEISMGLIAMTLFEPQVLVLVIRTVSNMYCWELLFVTTQYSSST
jgi:hypothetical protein